MIIAVDIDGTLCEDQNSWWEYEKAIPIIENIKKLNNLYHQNENEIILYTARFEENKEVTLQWLKKHQVRFHKIIFGKLRADMYIDNCARRMEEL
jgi:uncharacterized HAD superfamily protein